jgi:hypothetical protein
MDNEQLFYAYVIGVPIAAVITGFWLNPKDGEDYQFGWGFAVFWPFVAGGLLMTAVAIGPFWIGKQIRRLFP